VYSHVFLISFEVSQYCRVSPHRLSHSSPNWPYFSSGALKVFPIGIGQCRLLEIFRQCLNTKTLLNICNLIYKFTTSVTELGSVIDSRPGLAQHSRKKNHEDATKAGMHNCRSHSAQSSTAVLRHQVSSTRSHSPDPFPNLIHPVY